MGTLKTLNAYVALLLAATVSASCGTDDGGASMARGGDAGAGINRDAAFHVPAPDACNQSSDCDANQLCAYDGPVSGHCVTAPTRVCSGTDACYDGRLGLNFLKVPGDIGEGPGCNEACPRAEGGHQLGACVDVEGDGTRRICVPMCQYNDDEQTNNCVTDPRKGIAEACSRNHARLLSALRYTFVCGLGRQITSASCLTRSFQPPSHVEEAIQCMNDAQNGQSFSCSGFLSRNGSCVNDLNPNATASQAEIFEVAERNVAFDVEPAAGGGGTSGGSQQCSTDCDCGRCSYCEKTGSSAVCRYAGEGPYGCYRGCN